MGQKKLLNMKWVRLKMIDSNGLGPLEACLLCGFKQAEFNFMTFVDFATSAPRQRVILRGICLCGEVHETYDIKSEVINVCDNRNQCHNVMTLTPKRHKFVIKYAHLLTCHFSSTWCHK